MHNAECRFSNRPAKAVRHFAFCVLHYRRRFSAAARRGTMMAFRWKVTATGVALGLVLGGLLSAGGRTQAAAQGGAGAQTQAPAQAGAGAQGQAPAGQGQGRGRGFAPPYTPAKDAKDLRAVLFNWTSYMGMLRGLDEHELIVSLEYQGKGTMQVD